MFSYLFWRSAVERAVKTFAQTLVAILGAGGIGLLDAPWLTALSTALMAFVVSLLTSLTSAPIGRPNDPSLLRVENRPQRQNVLENFASTADATS